MPGAALIRHPICSCNVQNRITSCPRIAKRLNRGSNSRPHPHRIAVHGRNDLLAVPGQRHNLLGAPAGLPTTHSATARRRDKSVNDLLMNRFVAPLRRFDAPPFMLHRSDARMIQRFATWQENEQGVRKIWASIPIAYVERTMYIMVHGTETSHHCAVLPSLSGR